MSKNPLVSIILPVFNGEKYIKQSINSILAQTYHNFELIIINDGSTDSSQEIINSFNDNRIISIQQVNEGVAAACQKGLFIAKGKYIMRHDADDICLPEKLERQVKFLEAHNDIALVGTQVAFMTHRGKIAHDCRQPKNEYFEGKPYRLASIDDFNPYSPITHATILARTEVLRKLGGYRKEFLTSEDTDLWLRLLDYHKAAVLNKCDYFVRLNPASATRRYKKTINFYRNLAIQFAYERRNKGTDPLMRNESMPTPYQSEDQLKCRDSPKGTIFRDDLLHYRFRISLNAKDWKEVIWILGKAICDGWKLSRTWKSIFFQLLGERGTKVAVKIKSISNGIILFWR